MEFTQTNIYQKAFNQYLRRGTQIDISIKALLAIKAEAALLHSTPKYIWRTRNDSKVRASHVANNGKIFSWDNPPSTGNPGEDYGCRCTAEPYVQGSSEYAYQTLVSGMQDQPDKWSTVQFIRHFYNGNGVAVGLGETGNFQSIVDYYFYTLGKMNDINAQIIDKARNHSNGSFTYTFSGSYPFKAYLFAIGGAKVSGKFTGTINRSNGMVSITGTIDYEFHDTFTDPRNERQESIGTSEPQAATPELLRETEYGGTYYDIVGQWQTIFRAEAKNDERSSRYQWQ